MPAEPDALLTRAEAALAQAKVARRSGDDGLASYYYAHSLEWCETVEGRLGSAWALAAGGDVLRAAEECRKASAADPSDGRASNDLGAYLSQLGEDAEALPCFEHAVDAPKNAERQFAHYNLARLHERRGDLIQAEFSFAAALALDPGFDAAAKALERVRRKQQA